MIANPTDPPREVEAATVVPSANRPMSPAGRAYAERSLERFSRRINESVSVPFTRRQVRAILTALEFEAERASNLAPALQSLRETLRIALARMPL